MDLINEKQIQKGILDYLALKRGVIAWRNNSGTAQVKMGQKEYWVQLAPKGTPDIIGYMSDGKFLGIEVKKPGGVVSKEQQDFLNDLNDKGGLGFVAYSIDDVVDVLKNYGY
jgi:hypothetical protein